LVIIDSIFKLLLLCIFFATLIGYGITLNFAVLAYGAYAKAPLAPSGPTISDETLTVEKITDGLDFPTSMSFLRPDDILVTEKNTGKVMRIIDGVLMSQPIIDIPVATSIERGLLGIAISNSTDDKTDVFLYYTESGNGVDESDVENFIDPLGNRLYRY
jgi:aldose sugar dehydrogenase